MSRSPWGGYPTALAGPMGLTLPPGLQSVGGKLAGAKTSLITGYAEDPEAYVGAATGIARVGSWLVGNVRDWRSRRKATTAELEAASLAASMPPSSAPVMVIPAPAPSILSPGLVAAGLGVLGLLAFAAMGRRPAEGPRVNGLRRNPFGVIGIATVATALAAVGSAIGIGAAVKRGVQNRREKKAAGQTWIQRRRAKRSGVAYETTPAYTSSGMVPQGPTVEMTPVYDQAAMQAEAIMQQQKTMLWALVAGIGGLGLLFLLLRRGGSSSPVVVSTSRREAA